MTLLKSLSTRAAALLRRFGTSAEGNIVILFSLALVPMLLFVGAAIDYTRASGERSSLQAAIDATALSLALEPANTPLATLQAKGAVMFAANYKGDPATRPPLLLNVNGQQLSLSTGKQVSTSLMKLAGITSLAIGASTQVSFISVKLEISLALDNSGSMGNDGKLSALKTAVNSLVTTLQQAAPSADFVKLAIVPFNSQVNIGTGYRNASWLRYDTIIENPNFHGSSPNPPNSFSWAGCLTDRDQNFDASSAAPGGWPSNYVAANCEFPGLSQFMPLSSDHTTILNAVSAMTPNGATNITIGLTTALAALRPESPFGAASQPASASVRKFMIVFSDGMNTENRFRGTGVDGNPDVPQIELRMREACTSATGMPLQVFTIVLNSPDTSGVMHDCASTPGNHFNVTDVSQLQPVFNQIAKMIVNQSIRLML